MSVKGFVALWASSGQWQKIRSKIFTAVQTFVGQIAYRLRSKGKGRAHDHDFIVTDHSFDSDVVLRDQSHVHDFVHNDIAHVNDEIIT